MKTGTKKLANIAPNPQLNRRRFLGSLGSLALVSLTGCGSESSTGTATTAVASQTGAPIPVRAINHMTLNVSDPAASLAWYQGLFGMPIAARQGETIVLQVGDGPQFMAIGGSPSDNPRITHYCLAVDNFDDARLVQILAEHGVAATGQSGSLQSRVRMRGPEFGGAPGGSPELYFGDPDGIVVQLQDTSYCGGAGL